MSELQDEQMQPQPIRHWAGCLFYALLFTLISFLADQSNLFGFSTLISDQNERIYQRLTAGSYSDKSKIGQSKLAVMLYTDNATRLKGMGWPMKYDALAEQIEDVDDAGARGIFIDMVFRSSGRDTGAFCRLVQTMGEVSEMSLPSGFDSTNCLEMISSYELDLANSKNSSGDYWPLQLQRDTTGSEAFSDSKKLLLVGASLDYLNAREDLRKCKDDSHCRDASDAFINIINAWPATFIIDHVAQLVPLSVGALNGKALHLSVDTHGHVSPALQVVHHLGRFNPGGNFEFVSNELTMKDVLYLRWGNKVAEKQSYAKPLQQFGGCPGVEDGFLKYLRALAMQTFQQSNDDRNLTARCPYHLTIDMADYHNNVEIPPSLDDGQFQRFGFSMLEDLVQERFVLIGMSMDRLADTVDSPVHGRIAGIYAHAMAIDNLLEYGSGFSRAYLPEPGAVIQSDPGLTLFQYALTGVLAFIFLRYGAKTRNFFIRGQWSWICNGIGMLVTVAFMVLLLTSMVLRLQLEGSNWLDWLLAAFLVIGLAYTIFIFYGPRFMTGVDTKSTGKWTGLFVEGVRERNSGLKEFLPLIALVFVVWAVLVMVGVFAGCITNGDPFNFLFVFLSLCTLLVLALNNELFGGLATFLVGRSIASEFY